MFAADAILKKAQESSMCLVLAVTRGKVLMFGTGKVCGAMGNELGRPDTESVM